LRLAAQKLPVTTKFVVDVIMTFKIKMRNCMKIAEIKELSYKGVVERVDAEVKLIIRRRSIIHSPLIILLRLNNYAGRLRA
jgi:hypothetical protein